MVVLQLPTYSSVVPLQAQLKEDQQLATRLQASKDKAEEECNHKTAALATKNAEVKTLKQSLKRYAEHK